MARIALGSVGLLLWITGCAGSTDSAGQVRAGSQATDNGTARLTNTESDLTIVLQEDVDPELMAVWIAYGAARAAVWTERQGSSKNDSGDDFAIELEARRVAVDVYRELGISNPYFDFLSQVKDLGFLDEYVLVAFGKPGWTVPGSAIGDIDLDAFVPWSLEHLQGHEPQTGAGTVPSNGKRWPDVPGAAMPDPDTLRLPGEEVPCKAKAILRSIVDAWPAEAAKLDGRPLVADSAQHFLEVLHSLRAEPAMSAAGATWVPSHIYRAHFYAGFCAVVQHDYAYAKRALEAAVDLHPTHPNPRLELAHVYIFTKELDRAIAQVAAATDLTDDPCQIARGLRKIGYVRFEQGRWATAIAAYQESLRYEPDNPVALEELKLLEQASKSGSDPGDGAAGAGFSYRKTIVSTCVGTKLSE